MKITLFTKSSHCFDSLQIILIKIGNTCSGTYQTESLMSADPHAEHCFPCPSKTVTLHIFLAVYATQGTNRQLVFYIVHNSLKEKTTIHGEI